MRQLQSWYGAFKNGKKEERWKPVILLVTWLTERYKESERERERERRILSHAKPTGLGVDCHQLRMAVADSRGL